MVPHVPGDRGELGDVATGEIGGVEQVLHVSSWMPRRSEKPSE
jgi:hypothetical protein